jgi:hypothetical protein
MHLRIPTKEARMDTYLSTILGAITAWRAMRLPHTGSDVLKAMLQRLQATLDLCAAAFGSYFDEPPLSNAQDRAARGRG